jgi:hypothetical protein
MDSASSFNLLLVGKAFGLQIAGVAVKNVHVLRQNINVLEEIVPHKVVIRFGVITRQIDVFVHVERFHVTERNSALLVELNQFAVHAEWSTSYRLSSFNQKKSKQTKSFSLGNNSQ